VPVRRTTEFQIASITKVFAAATLMKLEHDGKLNIDDPVSNYLPGLPKPWAGVKLRELATHTSGLPDAIANPNKPLCDVELGRSADEALREVATRDVTAPPGARFQYDQTNYVLLKKVIEHVSGQNFREFVTANVLKSAMPGTLWGDARSIIPERSDMYTELHNNRIENGANLFEYPEYFDAAAGLNSNIADMEQFAAFLTSGKLLPSSELDKMWEAAKNRQGQVVDIAKEMELPGVAAPAVGWFFADNSGGKYPRVFMSGGSSTSILVFPKQRLCVVVLTNLQAKDDPLPLAENIAKSYVPQLQTMF
jgi:CubicO group peptidase (beta-lactamase class C family)